MNHLVLKCSNGNLGDTGEFGGCSGISFDCSVSRQSGSPKKLVVLGVGLLTHCGGLCSKQAPVALCLLSLSPCAGRLWCLLKLPSSLRAALRLRAGSGMQFGHLVAFFMHRHIPPGFSIVSIQLSSYQRERQQQHGLITIYRHERNGALRIAWKQEVGHQKPKRNSNGWSNLG